MTGLTGAVGAIYANRLSTALHTGLHPAALNPRPNKGLSPLANAMTMFVIAFPCQAAFMGCATWWGWIDVDLGLAGWLCFAVTVSLSPSGPYYAGRAWR
jgi:solute carrier family 41